MAAIVKAESGENLYFARYRKRLLDDAARAVVRLQVSHGKVRNSTGVCNFTLDEICPL